MQIVRNLSTLNFKPPAVRRGIIGNIAGTVVFLALFIFVVFFLEGILQNGGSVIERKRAIEQRTENSIDLMFIGNSHAYCTFDPAVMEEILDIDVFNAGLPDQKIDMTYYTLQEMLKKQKPATVVLEAFSFGRSNSEYEGFVANIDAMSPGIMKFRECFEIFPDKYEAFTMSIGLFRSHTNWKEPALIKENLKYMLGRPSKNYAGFNGFYRLESKMSSDTIKKYEEAEDIKFTPVVDDYSIGYFRRIAKLCRDKNIRLVVAMAPFNKLYTQKVKAAYSDFYSKMEKVCSDENVEYVDFNMLYDEAGLDFEDFEDAFHHAQHMNVWGAGKVSRYMAEYLKD